MDHLGHDVGLLLNEVGLLYGAEVRRRRCW